MVDVKIVPAEKISYMFTHGVFTCNSDLPNTTYSPALATLNYSILLEIDFDAIDKFLRNYNQRAIQVQSQAQQHGTDTSPAESVCTVKLTSRETVKLCNYSIL